MDKIPTILVVDDDMSICNFVDEALTEDGYLCEIALNACEALAKIENHHFDVTLLDVNLPDKSGIELIKSYHSFFNNTSIIMMTAVKDFNTALQAIKIGASDYVVKPFTVNELTASITEVLKFRKMRDLCSINTKMTELPNQEEKETNQPIKIIDTLAIGVEAQVDYFDFHSKIVTEKTIDLSRQLGLPGIEIERWESARNRRYDEMKDYIKVILDKLERNPIAQVMFGLTHSISAFSRIKEERN